MIDLILGGTNKAGTSSVFQYLADHPEICGSVMKETRFFLDDSYDVKMKSVYPFDGKRSTYDRFFPEAIATTKYRIEASPDYLYSPGTAQRISDFFEGRTHKMIFILRDPVSRFVSFFHYSKQIGNIPPEQTFEEYLQYNFSDQHNKYYYRALETGNYSKYLQAYLQKFDRDEVIVLFYEMLRQSPKDFMQQLSKKLDINPTFYEDYNFELVNKTLQIKNRKLDVIYQHIRSNVLPVLYRNKVLMALTAPLKALVVKWYKKSNTTVNVKEKVGRDQQAVIYQYYEEEFNNLQNLLDLQQPLPWSAQAASH